MARCSCCSRQYDPMTGIGQDTGMGRKPMVCDWADSPGWGVICSDCGAGIEKASTRDKAIAKWNELMLSQAPPPSIPIYKPTEEQDDIPF